ncbi:alpha/beta hydrolase [Streptomyces sp. SL13]|uniref:Alpha/beta hydrolase n=1 Tax=Streptantibioticus silvisoli TaxID=2705255 RepID=A0AA90JXG6_9ACTN|nr:alpha/beta hydrolase [Streptantibioticus silvisoli]MDI5970151.1 alpha/beta hydrolase [Streptantibioticus silvisoli]
MASQALPVRGARLGRAFGTGPASGARAVVLVLPEGRPAGDRAGASRAANAAARRLSRALQHAGQEAGLVTHVVHYGNRGWNGHHAHPARDAEWAADEALRRYGDVPLCLVGIGIGGRAALWAGGHDAVASVIALAPWLPIGREPNPVRHLIDRHVLIAHGTADAVHDPDLSFRFAERAKKINPDVCRFEVHADGHNLRHHGSEVRALTAHFALATLLPPHRFSRPVTDALAAPPPLGLRMPLASGYGKG